MSSKILFLGQEGGTKRFAQTYIIGINSISIAQNLIKKM